MNSYIKHTNGNYVSRITKGGKMLFTGDKQKAKAFNFNHALKMVMGIPYLVLERQQKAKKGINQFTWKP